MPAEQITDMKTRAPLRGAITFRKPDRSDGAAVWELVRNCKPLDENSMYCNLLQCDHFRDTCILAEMDGAVVGWISGYIPPSSPDTLFVWQVAVSQAARGRGLGIDMLAALLDRSDCAGVRQLQTTITRDNAASWALFSKFSRLRGEDLARVPYFRKEAHFDGAHDTEHMVTIPLETGARKAA